jgi:hypothetical protein
VRYRRATLRTIMDTPDTGYGSEAFLRVAANERVLVYIDGAGPRAIWRRMRSGYVERAWYRRRLPSIPIEVTAEPAGVMIAQHLAIREGRRFRFREAQGVLPLPAAFAEYQRGRHRQAVRTNVRRARAAGLTVPPPTLETWEPPPGDIRAPWISPGPIERWMVLDAEGAMVGYSIVSVDEHVALLHGLVSTVSDARWLLHTAIVERLCGNCRLLITNSAAMYRESYGNHHFQQLLGYQIRRLQVLDAPARPTPAARPAVAVLRGLRSVAFAASATETRRRASGEVAMDRRSR